MVERELGAALGAGADLTLTGRASGTFQTWDARSPRPGLASAPEGTRWLCFQRSGGKTLATWVVSLCLWLQVQAAGLTVHLLRWHKPWRPQNQNPGPQGEGLRNWGLGAIGAQGGATGTGPVPSDERLEEAPAP